MTILSFLVHVAVLGVVGTLVGWPKLVDPPDQSPESLEDDARRARFSLYVGRFLIVLGAGATLFDLLHDLHWGKVPWLLLDLLVFVMGIATLVPKVQDVVAPPFRCVAKVIRGSLVFHWQSLLLSFRAEKVRQTRRDLKSRYHRIFRDFPESSPEADAPTTCQMDSACAECGTADGLTNHARTCELRWSEKGVWSVVGFTVLGFALDIFTHSGLMSVPLENRLPGEVFVERGFSLWFTAVAFLGASVVTYLMAACRYVRVEYSLCDEHDSPSNPYPVVFVMDNAVCAEFGSGKVKGQLTYGKEAVPVPAKSGKTKAKSGRKAAALAPPEDDFEDPAVDLEAAEEFDDQWDWDGEDEAEPEPEPPEFNVLRLTEFPVAKNPAYPVGFSEDGSRLVAVNAGEKKCLVRVWDTESLSLVWDNTIKHVGIPVIDDGCVLYCRVVKTGWFSGEFQAVSVHGDTGEETVLGAFPPKRLDAARAGEIDDKNWYGMGVMHYYTRVHDGGRRFSYAAGDYRILMELPEGARRGFPATTTSDNFPAAVSPSGNFVAHPTWGPFYVTDATTRTSIELGSGRGNNYACMIHFTPDERFVLAAYHDHLELWDLDTGLRLWTLPDLKYTIGKRVIGNDYHQPGCGFAYSPDMSRLVVNCRKEAVLCLHSFDAPPVPVARLKVSSPVSSSAFSPDGERIALGHANGTVSLWQIVGG